MYQEINPEKWARKDAYFFYKNFDDPRFNLVADIDVTQLYQQCKTHGKSFFLACLFHAIRVTNELEAFRYRLVNDSLRLYDKINGASTIFLEDQTFRFVLFEHQKSLETFLEKGTEAIENEKKRTQLIPQNFLNLIHYSVVPWVSFRSLKHAQSKELNPSVPKIVFGKFYKENNRLKMPVSVEVHHALMDGFHLGQFFEAMAEL